MGGVCSDWLADDIGPVDGARVGEGGVGGKTLHRVRPLVLGEADRGSIRCRPLMLFNPLRALFLHRQKCWRLRDLIYDATGTSVRRGALTRVDWEGGVKKSCKLSVLSAPFFYSS